MRVSVSVIAGLAFLLTSLVLRRATINRHIRGRLFLSASLFAIYTLAAMGLAWLPLPPETYQQVHGVIPLLLAFGAINLVVALSINPWRIDRLPERFPNIVQDTLVIALFAVAATLILRERIVTTTAVGAVVIGFALQDTLGNLFAGLAIQVEKPFRVGDWVTLSSQDGMVSEITWRATKMRTKAGNFVVVPNSVLAKDTITNYSEPTRHLRLYVEVGVSYDAPPNLVKNVIREALRDDPEIAHDRGTEVLLVEFAASAITYRVRFWISDFEADERVKDRVRSLIYYALRRHGIAIPYPIQVQMSAEEAGITHSTTGVDEALLFAVPMFALLSNEERAELLKVARAMSCRGRSGCPSGRCRGFAVRSQARGCGREAGRRRGTRGAPSRRRRLRRDVAAHRRAANRDGGRGDRLRAARDRRRGLPASGARQSHRARPRDGSHHDAARRAGAPSRRSRAAHRGRRRAVTAVPGEELSARL